jgi:hypothetical protein
LDAGWSIRASVSQPSDVGSLGRLRAAPEGHSDQTPGPDKPNPHHALPQPPPSPATAARCAPPATLPAARTSGAPHKPPLAPSPSRSAGVGTTPPHNTSRYPGAGPPCPSSAERGTASGSTPPTASAAWFSYLHLAPPGSPTSTRRGRIT